MIYVQDSYFQPKVFNLLQQYCKQEFQIIDRGGKEFLVLPTPKELVPLLQIDGNELILSFIRKAHKEFDTSWRVHADNIIEGHKTSLASVLYISGNDVSENGTATWKHHLHGTRLPEDVTDEEFDRLLLEDANDLDKWERMDFIKSEPNRMLTYESNLFHSKWPNIIEEGERIVLVNFYRKLEV